MKTILFIFTFFYCGLLKAQFLITSPNYTYTQDFGTTTISGSGVNITSTSATLTGWSYDGAFNSEINILAAAPTNVGGRYAYRLNSGTDRKIGSRASGSTGIINYGILFQNTSGQAIKSFSVSYSAFQLSLGGNTNTNINKLTVDYKVSASPMLVDATGATNIPSLDYSQTQFTTTTNNTDQGAGFPSAISTGVNSGCVSISTAIPNNSYLLIRWTDTEDPQNDPHLAIDNVNVIFFTNQTVTNNTSCSFLPIDLLDFYATKNERSNTIIWKVAEEENVQYYKIEKSSDAVNFTELAIVPATYNSNYNKTYQIEDNEPYSDITYYRLSTIENNGITKQYKIVSVEEKTKDWASISYQKETDVVVEFKKSLPLNTTVALYDLSGKMLANKTVTCLQTKIDIQNLTAGIYFIKIISPHKTENTKLIIQK